MKFAAAAVLSLALQATDFYVSPNGADTNPGTRAKPFATLLRARDAVRAATPANGATVFLAHGDYPISATLEFTPADSGSPANPVTYRALPGATPRLTGGTPIRNFKPFKGAIQIANLPAQGITNYGALSRRGHGQPASPAALELFFQNQPMPLARWPNRGWAHLGDTTKEQFTVTSDRPARWRNAPDAWLHGYWNFDWSDSYLPIAAIAPATKTIRPQSPQSFFGYKTGQRWRALNLLEELDEPGEWYLDRANGNLYFWPPAPLAPGATVASLLATPILSLTNAANIRFQGLKFEHTRADAVTITGGANVVFAHCHLRNIGNRALVIQGGASHGIEDSEVAFTGDGAIELEGGDRPSLTPANHFARRNHIHHFGRWTRTYTAAVYLKGVGHHVSGNTIHHSPHLAILLAGNEHRIDHNDIHTVAMETHDVGAFYMGRDWTQRGNHVDANYFHNIGHSDVNAIYLDDFTSGTLVTNNVVERSHRGVLIGGGHDNIIRSNRFIACDMAIHFDARGRSWAKSWFDGRDTTLLTGLKAVPVDQEPWRTRYPELLTVTNGDPAYPKGNRLENNTAYASPLWVFYKDDLTAADIPQSGNQIHPEATPIRPEWVTGMGLPIQTPVIEERLKKISPTQARLTLTNRGLAPASGIYDIWADPSATVSPTSVPFTLKPGESKETTVQIQANGPIRLGAESRGETFSPAGLNLLNF
jgi:parallel beta-helix repeat protein